MLDTAILQSVFRSDRSTTLLLAVEVRCPHMRPRAHAGSVESDAQRAGPPHIGDGAAIWEPFSGLGGANRRLHWRFISMSLYSRHGVLKLWINSVMDWWLKLWIDSLKFFRCIIFIILIQSSLGRLCWYRFYHDFRVYYEISSYIISEFLLMYNLFVCSSYFLYFIIFQLVTGQDCCYILWHLHNAKSFSKSTTQFIFLCLMRDQN
jgi:hypothetical protein